MALQQFTNNARTTLASPINASALVLSVAAGTGSKFPSPTPPQYFIATLVNATNTAIYEVIKVTIRSGDVFTIVRAQEGTTAQPWNAGDLVNIYITAGGMQNLAQLDDLQSQRTNYAADSGLVNAYAVTLTPALTAHVIGLPIRFLATHTNTAASTFNDGAGAAPLIQQNGNGPLLPGQVTIGYTYTCEWNGSVFVLDGSYQVPQPQQDIYAGLSAPTPGQTAFNLSQVPIAGSVNFILDGSSLIPGIDFTVTGQVVTLAVGVTAGQTGYTYYSYMLGG